MERMREGTREGKKTDSLRFSLKAVVAQLSGERVWEEKQTHVLLKLRARPSH